MWPLRNNPVEQPYLAAMEAMAMEHRMPAGGSEEVQKAIAAFARTLHYTTGVKQHAMVLFLNDADAYVKIAAHMPPFLCDKRNQSFQYKGLRILCPPRQEDS